MKSIPTLLKMSSVLLIIAGLIYFMAQKSAELLVPYAWLLLVVIAALWFVALSFTLAGILEHLNKK